MSGTTENIFSVDKSGQTRLQRACIDHNLNAVRTLLGQIDPASKHAFVNKRNALNPSALTIACKLGHADIVAELIQHGADIVSQEHDGQTCFHAACDNNHGNIVQLLLDNVDTKSKLEFVNKRDRFKRTAFYLACYKGHSEVAVRVLDNGGDILGEDASGMTCLHVASMCEHADIVATLLDRVDTKSKLEFVNHVDSANRTALYFACGKGNSDIVAKLLQNGADINIASAYNGFTCLHEASHNNHVAVVGILLEAVDKDSKDELVNKGCKYNHTALFYAQERGNLDVVDLLTKHGAVIT